MLVPMESHFSQHCAFYEGQIGQATAEAIVKFLSSVTHSLSLASHSFPTCIIPSTPNVNIGDIKANRHLVIIPISNFKFNALTFAIGY